MARPGKAHTTALQHYCLTVGLYTAGMQTGERVRCRTSKADYPQPDYSTPTYRFSATSPRTSLALGKLPTRRRSLLSCVSAGFSLILPAYGGTPLYTLEVLPPYTRLGRILGGLSRQVTQSTVLMKLHTYPSSDVLKNPSTAQIHRYFHYTSHTNVTIKKQFTTQFTTVSPRVAARPRHYRGTKLQQHVVT